MPETPLADRVTILEAKMEKVDSFLANFDKTLEVRFREQAEMLDERFAQVFTEMDRQFQAVSNEIDRHFQAVSNEIGRHFALVFEQMDRGLASERSDIGALQRDMSILREGMKILLRRIR